MEKEQHWIGHPTAARRQTENGVLYRDPVNQALAIRFVVWGAADPLSERANLWEVDGFVEGLEASNAPKAGKYRARLNRIRERHKSGDMKACLSDADYINSEMRGQKTQERARLHREALELALSLMTRQGAAKSGSATDGQSTATPLHETVSPPMAGVDVAPATGADGSESAPPTASSRANGAAPSAALPSPLIAAAFDGLNGWDREKWAKYLGDPPKWLEKARARKGAQGAGDAATWNPVIIAVALSGKGAPLQKLDAVFRMRAVKAWSDEWEYRSEHLRP